MLDNLFNRVIHHGIDLGKCVCYRWFLHRSEDCFVVAGDHGIGEPLQSCIDLFLGYQLPPIVSRSEEISEAKSKLSVARLVRRNLRLWNVARNTKATIRGEFTLD